MDRAGAPAVAPKSHASSRGPVTGPGFHKWPPPPWPGRRASSADGGTVPGATVTFVVVAAQNRSQVAPRTSKPAPSESRDIRWSCSPNPVTEARRTSDGAVAGRGRQMRAEHAVRRQLPGRPAAPAQDQSTQGRRQHFTNNSGRSPSTRRAHHQSLSTILVQSKLSPPLSVPAGCARCTYTSFTPKKGRLSR